MRQQHVEQNKENWAQTAAQLEEKYSVEDTFSAVQVERVSIESVPVDSHDSKPATSVQSLFEEAKSINLGAVSNNAGADNQNNLVKTEEILSSAKESKPSSMRDINKLLDEVSERLSTDAANGDLVEQILELKLNLAHENEQLHSQFQEKEQVATRLLTLLDILPAGVVLLDGQGRVTECNPAAVDLLGEPLEGEQWFDVIKRCFSPKHDDGHEVSLKDGRRVRIETRSMDCGPGQLVLLSDLTETRLLQAQVSRAERLSSLGKMVASLAHQIRTPLSTAMLYAGHLCQKSINDDMRQDCAEKLLARLTHLEHQIRDMLIFAKGETRLAEQLKVKDFIKSLRSAAEPILAKASVNCEWEDAIPNKLLTCNKEALVGACLNLINNSIEAMEQAKSGGKQTAPLEISVNAKLIGSSILRLTVSDNGPGLSKAEESKVYEPFYTTKPQGTGLGLAVVQAVVNAHHGDFKLEPKEQGLTACINLPVFGVRSRRATSGKTVAKKSSAKQ